MVDVFFEGYGVWMVWEDAEANYPVSGRYKANGVFRLTEEDEIKYRHTGSFKGINTLCPSHHPDSEFSKMVNSGIFDSELAELAKARRFHSDDELAEADMIHELAKNVLFHFNADKKHTLVVAEPENIKTTAKTGYAWKAIAREIGKKKYKEKPSLSVDQIAEKVHSEMVMRKKNGESDVTGRGGKVPCAGSIKRHALSGIKSKSIRAMP